MYIFRPSLIPEYFFSHMFHNFFRRFYGRISDHADKHDSSTMDAICQNIDGLQKISGERIFSELKKTVHGKFGIELFVKLIECGAAPYIGIKLTIT